MRFMGCCARDASGHAAAPPNSVMNERRLIGARPQAGAARYHTVQRKPLLCTNSKIDRRIAASGQQQCTAYLLIL
jgi:hypothetical protein